MWQVTQLARDAAIKVCGPGVPLKAIGAAIQDVADTHKLKIVKDFIGHGVGKVFHATPQVRWTVAETTRFAMELCFMANVAVLMHVC